MQPERLTILPENGDPIVCQFNPEKYAVSKSLQLAEIGIPGLDAPVVQYVRGQNETIGMELFFDTTEHGRSGEKVEDVRKLTSEVYKLIKINSELHAPPRVRLLWGAAGQLTNHGASEPLLVLESINEEFTLFSPTGVPLRATLTVKFRHVLTIEKQLRKDPPKSSDRTKLYRVNRGDTISRIAHENYADVNLWRPIAEANALANPRLLEPGQVLTIPRLDSENRGSTKGKA